MRNKPPVSHNNPPATKAFSRRTKIILPPKLDELFQILKQN
ncbi:hypothetical protein Hsw_1989 [Hymenobacter swuensis DY53]|uniref:Uncharacterized protein n=1 Tax=Hymenobacter swuensis DY53 TaxID=1227739 RepID=W8EWY3_9BACT|nr:hypothetical protein Hsw_1989 [Hymenobacter swuensis DY53]